MDLSVLHKILCSIKYVKWFYGHWVVCILKIPDRDFTWKNNITKK